jgi:hypothetical protein
VPYWDGDLVAVGLGRSDDPRYLVYLAVSPGSPQVYIECEEPPKDSDFLYRVAGSGMYDSYVQVQRIVRQHLTR